MADIDLHSMISGPLSPWHGASSGCGSKNGLQFGGYLQIYWITSCKQLTRGGNPALGVGGDANNCSP